MRSPARPSRTWSPAAASTVGNALVDDPDIALITFTGSPDVGWGIKARAPRKKVGLELGNNAPVIIESDANWEAAADKIRVAGFSHAGQSCISTQRIYVQRALVDDFTAGLAERVRTLVVGDPLDEATEVSALISTGERERVSRGSRRRRPAAPRSWSAARSVPTACSCRRCSPT